MLPPKADGGFGRYRPSTVVVALGEPGSPVICCAEAGAEAVGSRKQLDNSAARNAADLVDMAPPQDQFIKRRRNAKVPLGFLFAFSEQASTAVRKQAVPHKNFRSCS